MQKVGIHAGPSVAVPSTWSVRLHCRPYICFRYPRLRIHHIRSKVFMLLCAARGRCITYLHPCPASRSSSLLLLLQDLNIALQYDVKCGTCLEESETLRRCALTWLRSFAKQIYRETNLSLIDYTFPWKVTLFCMHRMACTRQDTRQLMETSANSVSLHARVWACTLQHIRRPWNMGFE